MAAKDDLLCQLLVDFFTTLSSLMPQIDEWEQQCCSLLTSISDHTEQLTVCKRVRVSDLELSAYNEDLKEKLLNKIMKRLHSFLDELEQQEKWFRNQVAKVVSDKRAQCLTAAKESSDTLSMCQLLDWATEIDCVLRLESAKMNIALVNTTNNLVAGSKSHDCSKSDVKLSRHHAFSHDGNKEVNEQEGKDFCLDIRHRQLISFVLDATESFQEPSRKKSLQNTSVTSTPKSSTSTPNSSKGSSKKKNIKR